MADRLQYTPPLTDLELQQTAFDVYQGKSKWLDISNVTLGGTQKNVKRLSLNIAKVATAELANLVFSEDPQIEVSKEIEDILKENKFIKNSKNFVEYIAALGGGAYKLRSDGEQIIIDFVKAYNFIPVSWDNSRVYEADFISQKTHENKKYKIIEKHRRYYQNIPMQNEDGTMMLVDGLPVLTDELYFTGYKITTEAELNGKKVALPPGLEEEQIIKVKRPLFAYVKTAIANNFDPDSPIGISYYGNALDTIQALDIAFDGLNNEVLLGRKRIFVPHTAIKYVTNPETNQRTRYYDPDDSVYVAMKGADNQTLDIHDNTQELRIEEIKLSIQTLLDIFCMQVGFSQGFLSFDGSSVKTATEVISNNSKTFKTKSAFENEIKDGMYDIIQAIAELLIVNGYSADNKCVITFNDSIIEDRNAKTEYWINLVNNGLCTKKKALMKIHGIDEEAAQKMLDEIAEEQPTPPTIGF